MIFTDTFEYILSLDPEAFIRVFWFFLILDFPRYILTDLYLLFQQVGQKMTSKRDQEFRVRLNENPPLVSVIIPALNEQETIAWTVRSLQEQTYKNLEIIIVDDGSTDDTPQICRTLANHAKVQFYRFSDRAGKSAVLNYGLKFAHGEFIVFVDSDTTFDRDAIYNMMAGFSDPVVGGVAGNLRTRNGSKNLLTNLQQLEYIFTISIGRRIRAQFGILPIISGAFGGFRKDLISLETMGGHEPGPGNDSDLVIRLRKKGYKIVFAPSAICLTNVPEKVVKLVKQRSRWDRNLIKNRLKKHRDVFNPFTQNFRLIDVITFVDSVFFHLILSLVTVFYLFDISLNYLTVLPYLLLINFFLYFCVEVIELLIAVILSKQKADLWLLLFLPLFNPYKLFIKFVRINAYLQELIFKASYRDPFAPHKVRQKMIRW